MTNTPEQYLAEAKEKVAKEQGYKYWREYTEHCGHESISYERAALLALQAQAEDYEKRVKIQSEILDANKRLAQSIKEWQEIAKNLETKNDQLKAELEKAKQLCTESQLSIHGLVQVMNGSYELKDRYMKAVDLVDKLNEFLTPTGDEGQNR